MSPPDPHITPILSTLLPPGIVVAESFDHIPEPMMFPEELEVIGRAVEKRKREFATARALARRALAELGFPPAPILPGPRREPQWPAGAVGSITHCSGYCAAAVARDGAFAAIGIDAEGHGPLPEGVLRHVAGGEEREWLASRASDGIQWDRLVFSAKESVYKAWFPIMRQWLGFEAVIVRFDEHASSFRAEFVAERPVVEGRTLSAFEGRYLVRGAHVFTAIAVPHG